MLKEIEKHVRKIIEENVDTEISAMIMDSNKSLEDFGINSISYIKIIVAIENQFEFEFADEDLDMKNFKTLGNLISYISQKVT